MATKAATAHGHATTTHTGHPNYMNIFWVLLVLTILEVGVSYMKIDK